MDSSAQRRLEVALRHLRPELHAIAAGLSAQDCSAGSASTPAAAAAAEEERPERKDVLKWNGWGFNDTKFEVDKDGVVALSGSRYMFSGQKLPYMRNFMETVIGLDLNHETPPTATLSCPTPKLNSAFLDEIRGSVDSICMDDKDRVMHSHGHTAEEIFALRYGKLHRIVDAVVYPGCHAHCEAVVKSALKHNVCLIPYGGGTSVSHALLIPENEHRMVCAFIVFGCVLSISLTLVL
jgi:alkyldihydroxyacetonephosphate synthase